MQAEESRKIKCRWRTKHEFIAGYLIELHQKAIMLQRPSNVENA